MRKIATIEARMSSSRLPGKILKPILGKPSLERLVERARQSRVLDDVVVATTTSPADDAVESWAKSCGVSFYRGSEEDVLLRVLEAAKAFRADVIVELTGDCPLVDPDLIDQLMDFYVTGHFDYVSNILKRTYPRGLDTQIFSTAILEKVHHLTRDPADRENVSLYIYEHPEKFKLGGLEAPHDLYGPDIRICVDMPEDFEVVEAIFRHCYPVNPQFRSRDVMRFLKNNPRVAAINSHIQQKRVRV